MKSSFKHAAGLQSQFFVDVVDGVEEEIGDASDDAIEKAYKSKKFAKDVAKLIVAGANGAKNVLHILSNLPLADRIARGKYGWVNSDITEEHFPTNIPSDYDTEYKLFHFNRSIGSDDAIREMEKEGFRPATLAELLVLGETQPELQKQFPIIALGSVWRHSGGSRYVPGLGWDGDGRELALYWFGGDWGGYDRFLAVRK